MPRRSFDSYDSDRNWERESRLERDLSRQPDLHRPAPVLTSADLLERAALAAGMSTAAWAEDDDANDGSSADFARDCAADDEWCP
jgi:hypothetical protein